MLLANDGIVTRYMYLFQDGCDVINQGRCSDTLHVSYQEPGEEEKTWLEVQTPALFLSNTRYLTVTLRSCSRRLFQSREEEWGLDSYRETFGTCFVLCSHSMSLWQ